jgi:hypothetical protein
MTESVNAAGTSPVLGYGSDPDLNISANDADPKSNTG